MTGSCVKLSICVPTFNRAQWLRLSLPRWAEQASQFSNDCEIVVCDNASDDQTQDVACALESEFGKVIRYHRNAQNIGGNPNFFKCVNQLAQGEYVWVVGDDDFPTPGAITRVLQALALYPNFKHFLVGYEARDLSLALDEPETLSSLLHCEVEGKAQGRCLSKTAEMLEISDCCFMSIYTLVLRREVAVAAFEGSLHEPAFTTLRSVGSHAIYIADHFFKKPTYYLEAPCLVASTSCSWTRFAPIFYLRWLPELFDYMERAGAKRRVMDRHRRLALLSANYFLWAAFGEREMLLREHLAFHRFVWTQKHLFSMWSRVALTCAYMVWERTPLGFKNALRLVYWKWKPHHRQNSKVFKSDKNASR